MHTLVSVVMDTCRGVEYRAHCLEVAQIQYCCGCIGRAPDQVDICNPIITSEYNN
jgi:hypothetical protein